TDARPPLQRRSGSTRRRDSTRTGCMPNSPKLAHSPRRAPMRTFKLTLGLDLTATVPQEVEDAILKAATEVGPEGQPIPPYLAQLYAEYGHDLDEFILAVLKANLRGKVRGYTKHMLDQAGIGVRLSPISVKTLDFQDADFQPT